MQRLFRTMGRLFWVEDAHGKKISKIPENGLPVLVDIQYELNPLPHSPLKIEIYGQNLIGMGQTRERLELDNGVVLTGRMLGGGFGGDKSEIRKVKFVDVEELKFELFPTEADSSSSDVDSVVAGLVSSCPLGHGICANGVARPGYPFSYRIDFPNKKRGTWSTSALRLYQENLEITFVETSRYWRRLVNKRELQHDTIVGIRRLDGNALDWDEINRIISLISNFLGWINHCSSPVFHIKGYRKGQLVYKGYDLHPNPTVRRDIFSWLPMFDSDRQSEANAELIQELLNGFAKAWIQNEEDDGIFHIALLMLRNHSKGSPRDRIALLYLRNTFSACSILVSMLAGSGGSRSRHDVIRKSLEKIGLVDELPVRSQIERDHIERNYPDLWSLRNGKILKNEIGTLSRPLANVENWLIHIEDPNNASRLLNLHSSVQHYFVEISIWLADLMILKVIGYRNKYFNRLTRKTEVVPWVK